MSSTETDISHDTELSVTFQPPLYEQRRAWILDVLRHEKVTEVLDAGCGEGETIACLCNPAPWRSPDSVALSTLTSDMALTYEELTVCVMRDDFLHMRKLFAFDISLPILKEAIRITKPPESIPGSWHGYTRWEPLEVKFWEGGLESYNDTFVDIDCIICTEVIEHLPEDIVPEFAPMLLGVYHPRLLLITTPSYTFNARFTAPDAPSEARQGYPDPTGRTTRIFRHDDHKFEWTVPEFTEWCTDVANKWGYAVDVSGVGKPREKDEWGRDDELGYASQIAKFRRKEGDDWIRTRKTRAEQTGIWTRTATRQQQKAVTSYLHEAHAAAGKIDSSEGIAECIKAKLDTWNIGSTTIHELWFEEDVSSLCGGWLNIFLAIVENREDFELHRTGNRTLDWTLTWSGFVEKIEPEAEENKDMDRIRSVGGDLDGPWGETPNSWSQETNDEETQLGSDSQTDAWGKEYLGDNGSSSAWGGQCGWESKQETVEGDVVSGVWDRSTAATTDW